MTTRRRLQFVYVQTGMMLAGIVTLVAFGAFSLELFFVCALIGLLVTTELTSSIALTPRWRWRLRGLILLGLAGFGYIVVNRALSILSAN